VIALPESDLRQRVAELLVIRSSGHLYDSQREYPEWELNNNELKRLLGEGVGGVIFVGGSSNELAQRIKSLRSWSPKSLLLCADVEEGFGQRFGGGTWLVPPLSVGQIFRRDSKKAIAFAEEYGRCTGFQARTCGLNWVLAPVCDINSNPTNPVINVRAWGEDADTVSVLTSAFYKGLASQGVLSCAKHFPGHGDTSVDSHLELPVLAHDLRRLEEFEFLPFKTLISAGVETVMSAHVLLQKIDSQYPATLSRKVLTGVLREKIGFDRLLVTDALMMEAISRTYGCGEAAVMAFAAGADLLMMPAKPDEAIDAVCKALASGRLSMNRLEESLLRRRKALAKVESFHSLVHHQKIITGELEIQRDVDISLSKELISGSITINKQLELDDNHCGINLLRVDSLLTCPFLNSFAPAFSIPEEVGFKTVICHHLGVSPWQNDFDEPFALTRFSDAPFLLQIFSRGKPFLGDLNKQEPWAAVIKQLQRLKRLSGLIVYGSPYLWIELSDVLDPSIPSAYSPGQMPEAQHQVLSTLLASGKVNKFCQSQRNREFTD